MGITASLNRLGVSETACERLYRAHPTRDVVQPDDYLAAAGELLVLAFVVGYALTATYDPESFESNPLKRRIGYNNACVLFDSDPARNVACTLIAVSVYFLMTYVRLDSTRLFLQKDRLSRAVRCYCVWSMRLYGISLCVFLNVFLIRPRRDPALHTFFFAQFIFFRYVGIVSNYVEHRALGYTMSASVCMFLAAYTFTSIALPCLLAVDFAYYDDDDDTDPAVPASLLMCIDYAWFLCVFLTTKVQPGVSAPPLRRSYVLAEGVPDVSLGRSASRGEAEVPLVARFGGSSS